jgi:DNA mismatch repair protein MutS
MNEENISNEYFKYYKKYEKEYGKICVLMQIGSFYEMLMLETKDEKIGNLNDIANILNIQVTKRNKNLDHLLNNPFMAGFPKVSVNKYLPLLLENNYTVILIDQNEEKQKGKVTRFVSGIYSSSIQPIDYDSFKDDGNDLTCILIEIIENTNIKLNKEKYSFLYSFINLNLTTNKFDLYEYSENSLNSLMDKIFKIFSRYKNTEIIVKIINNQQNKDNDEKQNEHDQTDVIDKNYFLDYMNLSSSNCIHWKNLDIKNDSNYKMYNDLNYQNSYLKKIYSHINFGLLQPIQFFDLEKYQLSVYNILETIDFIVKHDEKYTKNLEIPKIIEEYDYLTLEMNTLNQLDIINKFNGKSLFDVINKTITSIGKRGLKNLLLKPFKNPDIIQKRYELMDSFENTIKNLEKDSLFTNKSIDNYLTEICDFEKLHRKISLQSLHPYQFYSLNNSYHKIKDLIHIFIDSEFNKIFPLNNTFKNLNEYIHDYLNIFNINELKKYNLNDLSNNIIDIFNKNNIKEIDTVLYEIKNIEKQIENFKNELEQIIIKTGKLQNSNDLIKLAYSETEGYSLTCTKLRFNLLKKGMDKNDFEKLNVKINTNLCKISSDSFNKLSIQLNLKKDVLCKLNKIHYFNKLNYFYDKYSKINLFMELKNFIELIDILNSNLKCKNKFNYCKPNIIKSNDNEAFLNAKDIRHPIIEQLNNNLEYIPNDVSLNDKNNGIILYALNSSGKSSLLRSIGISVILAQCGLYVPCTKFEYYPFNSIITQVDMYDNLWKGQSSFVSEMIGLKKILKLADENSLILSDELTKGTEVISATSIFSASILELLKKNSKFIFTTHLHQVATLDIIKTQKKLQISHLSVEIINNEIIFHRKLKPGPCSELYGLEVAKAVGLDSHFIDSAFEIRNNLIKNKKQIVTTKKSKYNTKKLIDKCEICGYYPSNKTDIPLDIHHIDFQCNADENNFTRHFHKNSLHNLVCLCKQCHQNVHLNKIKINGYIQTSNGIKLDFKN